MPPQVRVGRQAKIDYSPSDSHTTQHGRQKSDQKASKANCTNPQKSKLTAQVNHQ